MVKHMIKFAVASVGALLLVACSSVTDSRTVTLNNGAQIQQLNLKPITAQREFNALSAKAETEDAAPEVMIKLVSDAAKAATLTTKTDAPANIAPASPMADAQAAQTAQSHDYALDNARHCPGHAAPIGTSLDD